MVTIEPGANLEDGSVHFERWRGDQSQGSLDLSLQFVLGMLDQKGRIGRLTDSSRKCQRIS